MRDMEGWRGEVVKSHMSHSSEVLPPGQWAAGEVTPTPNLSRPSLLPQPPGLLIWKQEGQVSGRSPHSCLLSLHEASGTLRGCQCPDTPSAEVN